MKTYQKDLAVIFLNTDELLEYAALSQLKAMGITNAYILLSKDEISDFNQKPIDVFEFKNKADVYRFFFPNMMVINTENINTDKEKIDHYQKYLEINARNYIMNIFISAHSIDGLSRCLPYQGSTKVTTTYVGLFEYSKFYNPEVPPIIGPSFTGEALELVQRPINPGIFWQKSWFDVTNYTWIMHLFVHLCNEKIWTQNPSYIETGNQLINSFNASTQLLKKAEQAFEESHKQRYFRENPGSWITNKHSRNVAYKEELEIKIQQTVCNFVQLFKAAIVGYPFTLPAPEYYVAQNIFAL